MKAKGSWELVPCFFRFPAWVKFGLEQWSKKEKRSQASIVLDVMIEKVREWIETQKQLETQNEKGGKR